MSAETEGGEYNRLDDLREQIIAVDIELVHLLDRRMGLTGAVGAYKAEHGATQIRNLGREDEVVDHALHIGDGTTRPEGLARIVRVIMDVSSEQQAEDTGLPLGEPTMSRPVRPADVPRRSSDWRGW